MSGRRDVVKITGAAASGEDDVAQRMRKYLITMGIRMACLVLAFVVPGFWKILCLVGAILLPWVAVMIATAGRERSGSGPEMTIVVPAHPALGRAREAEVREQEPLQGTVVEQAEDDPSADPAPDTPADDAVIVIDADPGPVPPDEEDPEA